jgi:hypothetical protein
MEKKRVSAAFFFDISDPDERQRKCLGCRGGAVRFQTAASSKGSMHLTPLSGPV